jgi:hypothetical protein
LDVTNKRVGVLGCGASGVQVITSIAPSVASNVEIPGMLGRFAFDKAPIAVMK